MTILFLLLFLCPYASALTGPDGFLLQDSRGTGVFVGAAGLTVMLTSDVMQNSALSCNLMQVTLERRQRHFRTRQESGLPRGNTRYVMTRGRAVCRNAPPAVSVQIRTMELDTLTLEVGNEGDIPVAMRLRMIASIALDLDDLRKQRVVPPAEARLHQRDERKGVRSRLLLSTLPYCVLEKMEGDCSSELNISQVTNASPDNFKGILGAGERIILTIHLEEFHHRSDLAFAVVDYHDTDRTISATPFIMVEKP